MAHSTAALAIALSLQACIHPSLPAPNSGELVVSATDYRGSPVPLLELPRRPRLVLTHPGGIEPVETSLVLFAGAADAAWEEDLTRAPLRAEHSAQTLACNFEATADGVVLTPQAGLPMGADYVLAVAAWAKTRAGTLLGDKGSSHLFTLKTTDVATAGAAVRASWPLDGMSDVSPHLSEALLALDGVVEGADAGIWLEGPDGLAVDASVRAGPCAELAPDQTQPHCVVLSPKGILAADTPYRIVVGQAAVDAHGAPVGPFEARFRTGTASDVHPPTVLAPACAIDEQNIGYACVLASDTTLHIRALASEPSRIVAVIGGQTVGIATAPGEFSLAVVDLPSDRDLQLELSVRDSADLADEHRASLHTTTPLPLVSVTEVLADPLGPEPAQEWIEVLNAGPDALDLDGYTLSDVPSKVGQVIEHPPLIAPHTRALLVSDDYDPNSDKDAKPPPGTMLIRVGRALTGDGLRNGGAELFLRDPLQRRVSAAPATPRPRPGQCIVRRSMDPRDGSDGTFEAAPTCSPGVD